MVTKLKLRIVDGIPEVDGEPTEIAEVLRQLSNTKQPIQPSQPAPQHEEREISNNHDIEEINSEKLLEIIESSGEPITFSMGDLQKKIYGRRISSRNETKLYQTFRIAFDNAKKQLERKHPDHHLEAITISVENVPTKRFKLIRNFPIPVQQRIEANAEQPKAQLQDEEVAFKM